MSLKAVISRSALSYTRLAVVKSQIIPGIVIRCLSDRIVDPPDLTPPIPEYVERSDDEPKDVRRARLLYQSRKRGMAENCLLLSTFAKKHLHTFDSEQLKQYDDLINKPSNDWELYYWMTGTKPTPDEYNNAMMDMLKEHARNDDRDARIEQPPL